MDAFTPRTSIFTLASEPPSRPLSRASSTATEVPGAPRSLTREVEHIKTLITRAGLTSKTNDSSITATLFRLSGRQENVTQAHILQELDGLKRRIRAETRPAPKPALEDDPETEAESEDGDIVDERDDELDTVRAELHRVRQQREKWIEAAEERVDQLAEEKATLQQQLSTCQQERDGSKSETRALAEKQRTHESTLSELRSAHAQQVSILERTSSESVEHEQRAAQVELEGRDNRIRQLQENVTRLESSVGTLDKTVEQAKEDAERQRKETQAKQKAADERHHATLRTQREQLQSEHDKRYLALHAAHSKALQQAQAHADETLAQKDKDLALQTQQHEGAISKLQGEHDATVSMLRVQHEQAWSDLGSQAEEATDQARVKHEAAMTAEREQLQQEKNELLSAHKAALETQRKHYDEQHKAQQTKQSAAMERITQLQAQHEASQANASRQSDALRNEHEHNRAQLEAVSAEQLTSMQQKHALELDRLQSDKDTAIKSSVEVGEIRSATLIAELQRQHQEERDSWAQQVTALRDKVKTTADEGLEDRKRALANQTTSHTLAIEQLDAELVKAREEHQSALADLTTRSLEDSEAAQRSFDEARLRIAQEHAAEIAEREASMQTSKQNADSRLQAALDTTKRQAVEKKTAHEVELREVKTVHREELARAAQKSRKELAQLKALQADELARERKSRSGSVNAQQFKDAKIMFALQAQLEEANNSLSTLRQQMTEEQSTSSANVDTLQSELSTLRQQSTEERSAASTNIDTLRKDLDALRKQMTEERSAASTKSDSLQQELVTLRQSQADATSRESILRHELSAAATSVGTSQKELDAVRQSTAEAFSRESVLRDQQSANMKNIEALQKELDTLRQSQADAANRESVLTEEHTAELQSLTGRHTSAMDKLKAEHDAVLQAALTNADSMKQGHETYLQSVNNEHDRKLQSLKEQHNTAMQDATTRTTTLTTEHQAQLQALQDEHASSLAQTKAEYEDNLAQHLDKAENESQQLFDEIIKAHEAKRMSELAAHEQELASLREEQERARSTLTAGHAAAVSRVEAEHRQELAAVREEQESKCKALTAEHTAVVSRMEGQHTQELEEQEDRCNALTAEHTAVVSRMKGEHTQELEEQENRRNALTAEHIAAISHGKQEHTIAIQELQAKVLAAENASETAQNATKEKIDAAVALQTQFDAQQAELDDVRKALRQVQVVSERKAKELAEASEVIRLDEHKITTMQIELTNVHAKVAEGQVGTADQIIRTHKRAASAVEGRNARYTSRGMQTSARIDVIGGSPRRSTHRRNISTPVDLSKGELKNNGSPVQSKRSSLVFGPELITAITGSPLARATQRADERPGTPTSPVISGNFDSPDVMVRRRTVHDYVQQTEPQLYEPGSVITANEALLARMIREHVGDMQKARDSLAKEYQSRFEALMREKERLDRQVTMEQATEFVTERERVSQRYLAQEQQTAMDGTTKPRHVLEEEQRLVEKYNKRIAKRKSQIRLQHADDFHNLTQDYDRRLADLLQQKSELEGDLKFGQADIQDESDSHRQPRSIKPKNSIDSIKSTTSRKSTSSIPRPVSRFASFGKEKEVLQVSNAEHSSSNGARSQPPVPQRSLKRLQTPPQEADSSQRSSLNVDLDSPLRPVASENPDTDYVGDVAEFEKQGRALRRQSGSPNIKADTRRVSSPRGEGRPASIRSERSKRHSSSVIYDRGS